MDKDFWKGFLSFLDNASVEELREKCRSEALLEHARQPDVRSDAKRMLRLMAQELLAPLGQ